MEKTELSYPNLVALLQAQAAACPEKTAFTCSPMTNKAGPGSLASVMGSWTKRPGPWPCTSSKGDCRPATGR